MPLPGPSGPMPSCGPVARPPASATPAPVSGSPRRSGRSPRLAAQGLSNWQIAEQLFVSRHTVSYHLHKIYAKLGITSRADLRELDLDDGLSG